MNTYLTVSSLFNVLAALLQVVLILSSPNRSVVRKRYIYFLLAITGWSFAYTLWRLSTNEAYALFYCNVLISSAVVEPVAFLHFTLALTGKQADRAVRWGYVGAFLLIAAVPFGLIVDGVSEKFGHLFWPDAGVLMPVYLLFFNGYLIASLVVLFKAWSQNVGGKASDYLIVMLSAVIGFTGGGTNFPLWYDIPIQPYGNILVSVYLFLMIHGLYHNKIFGFSLDFYKAFVGLLLNASVALFYILFYVLFANLTDTSVSVTDIWLRGFIVFGCSAVAFWGIPQFKYRIENMLEGVFRRDRVIALSELKNLPVRLSEIADENSMYETVGTCLTGSFDVTGVAVFRLEEFDSEYRCRYRDGVFPVDPVAYKIGLDSPLVDGLIRTPEVLVLAQIFGELTEDYYDAIVGVRNDIGVSVIIPIFAEKDLYGIILLGELNEVRSFSEEEIVNLYNLGAQIGINLRTRDLERRANEVDKLVALGTMAAGLSHEIRNPLVSVQTLASLVASGRSLDAVSADFKDVLLRDVKRIVSIVDGVAMYSLEQVSKKTPVPVIIAVESSLEIYRKQIADAGVEIRCDFNGHEAVMTLGVMDQLMQVFNNLIENSLHALSHVVDPVLSIEIVQQIKVGGRNQSWIEVIFSDNGAGISETILGRIFDPFITSKDTGERTEKIGMGLGLAISKRIIDSHGGVISAMNNESGGARFVVSLTTFENSNDYYANE
ncbi:MAG: ATP-binding protein [Opitutaceae bacterium]